MNTQIDMQRLTGLIDELNGILSQQVQESVTLEEYMTGVYLPYLQNRPSKKPQNFRKEKQMVNVILTYPIAKLSINFINISDLETFFTTLRIRRKISVSTVNRYRARLSAVFNHALRGGSVCSNPIRLIKKYREYPRTRYLTALEAFNLLKECRDSKNKELYLIVVLALNTGMRLGEILNLTHTNCFADHILLSAEQTKSGLPRIVPLNGCARNILKSYINGEESGKIFKSRSIRECFKYAKKRADVAGFRFHDLRRTCATYLKDEGVDIHTISKILGHSSIVTTERYLGTDEKKLLDSVSKIGFI